jgi:hypothetical protein
MFPRKLLFLDYVRPGDFAEVVFEGLLCKSLRLCIGNFEVSHDTPVSIDQDFQTISSKDTTFPE